MQTDIIFHLGDNQEDQLNNTIMYYMCKFAIITNIRKLHITFGLRSQIHQSNQRDPQAALDAQVLASLKDLEDLDALNLTILSTRSSSIII